MNHSFKSTGQQGLNITDMNLPRNPKEQISSYENPEVTDSMPIGTHPVSDMVYHTA
ncbi:hypothetical protein ACTXT7_008213 [Hymenolepis weldensis]